LLLPTSDVFYVEGRYLYDNDRRKVILRAINLPLLDDWNFPGSDKPLLLMTQHTV
jgi:mannan endo-1,4-beta-mannosidase